MRKLLSLLAVLMLCTALVSAQNRTITGQVKDENGKPVPFATVQVKGDLTGVSADAQGNFKINAQTKDVLVISAVNFSSREIAVPVSGSVAVSLETVAKTETEVIVTAQGIRRRPRELGYSVAKVTNAELTNGKSPQIAAGLSGKVSGLVIVNANSSVDPAVKFNLRGYRSMSGNNDALIVIDGLPQPNGNSTMFNLINPNDVESISVLKGGQAATIYGSAGINGAIIITTKKGQKGKLKVDYSSSYNAERINLIAQFQEKFGSGSHYAAGFGTAGYLTNYLDRLKANWRSYENQQFGDEYDGSMRPVGRILEDGSVYTLPYSPIKDVRKDIWNTGSTLNNQVSFSGGSDNSTFFFSAENNKTEGIVPKDKSNRTGARFAASQEYNKLRIGFSANYVQVKYDRTTFNFYDESINQAAHIPLPDLKDWKNNKFANPNGYYNDYYSNPYFRLDNYRTKYQDANFNGAADISYKILPWLSISDKLNMMQNTRTQKSTVGQFFHSTWAKTQAKVPAPFDQGDGSGITRALTDLQGSVSDASNTENLVNNELQLSANKNFKNFTVKALVGYNVYTRKTKSVGVNSNSIVVPDIYNVSNRRGELGGSEGNTEERKFAYYADALIGWKDMVFLHGTFRNDATSRFYKPSRAKDQYTYSYPGVDVSAIITELIPSLKSKVLNFAKLRAGYNKNGNDNLGLYGLDPTFGNAGGFPYGNTVGISVGDVLPEGGLTPEFVKSLEAGGEFQLFNNKLNLDISYYTQRSEGQVLRVTIPSSTGFSNLVLNVGDTKNWGWEADVKVQVLRTKKLNWDLSLRGSINENKVIKLYPGVSEFFVSGYTYAGTFVMQDQVYPVLKSISYVRDSVGRVVVSSATGYPLTTGPLKNLGRVTPKYMLGAGTTISYSGLTLTTNWEYRGGNVMYSDIGRQMTFTGSGKWTDNRAPQIWPNSSYLDPGGSGKYIANTTVMTREAEYALWADNYRLIAEAFTVPAWFIKMRDISLTYSFPNKLMSKTHVFSNATVGLYGRNLITILDKANQFADPEFSFTTGNGVGINNTDQTPTVRQFGVNLNLTFK
ncbi:MAG: SusC/RagA family TonB-linked outer membrane protein [Bacteroidota bacterium]